MSTRPYRVKISIHYTLFLCIISLLVSTKLIVLFFAVSKHSDSMWPDCFTIETLTTKPETFFQTDYWSEYHFHSLMFVSHD